MERERGQERNRGADEIRAGIAEIDARGRTVQRQESEERPGEPEADRGGATTEDREARADHRADAGREPILAVEEVHGVEQPEHEDGGGDAGERRTGDDERADRGDPEFDEDAERNRQWSEVVGETERECGTHRNEEDRAAGEQRPRRRGERDRDPAEVGDRDPLGLEFAGTVDDIEGEGDAADDRGEDQTADQSDHQRYDAVHTKTSDDRPACTSTSAARSYPAA